MARPGAGFAAGDFFGVFRMRGVAFLGPAVFARVVAGLFLALADLVFGRGAALRADLTFDALLAVILGVVLGALFFFTARFLLASDRVDCFLDFAVCVFLLGALCFGVPAFFILGAVFLAAAFRAGFFLGVALVDVFLRVFFWDSALLTMDTASCGLSVAFIL